MGFKSALKNILPPTIWFFLKEKLANNNDEVLIVKKFFENKKTGVMIDVGACYGTSFIPFTLKGWKVYAFEPDIDNYTTLVHYTNKWGLTGRYSLSANALSDKPGVLKFYKNPESIGISSLNNFDEKHYFSHEVTTTTIRDFVKENQIPQIDFLKIDTEGYDLFVLKGSDLSNTNPKVILCEFEDKKTERLGYTVNDMIKYLQEYQYEVLISLWKPIKRYGESHKWEKYTISPGDIKKDYWGNLIAVKKEDFTRLKQVVGLHD